MCILIRAQYIVVVIVTKYIYKGVSSQVTMFKNTFQSGFLSILYSIGSKPLQIWDKEVDKRVICFNSETFYVVECALNIEYYR